LRRKERDATRGSPRSFAAQRTLAQDDIKIWWSVSSKPTHYAESVIGCICRGNLYNDQFP
jgi:hypothetical protein